MVDVILGLQWGDEGKGKIVDFFAKDYDLVARFQGGPNAGHTLYVNDKKVVLHQIPSGVFHPGIINLIGNNAQKNFSRHRIAWLIISNKKAMFFGHRFKKFIANRLCYFQHIQFTVA